jgi:hypothetical protein
VESGQKIEGVALVSHCLLDLFVRHCVANPMTFTSMVAYEDFVINTNFWLMLGILFRLPTLPLSTQFANVPAPAPDTRLSAG